MIILTNKEIIVKLIEENHKLTNGSCGMSMIQLKEKSGIDYDNLKQTLNILFQEKKIKVRHGINNKLIFYGFNTTSKRKRL